MVVACCPSAWEQLCTCQLLRVPALERTTKGCQALCDRPAVRQDCFQGQDSMSDPLCYSLPLE